MLFLVALLLAIFLLPSPWGAVVAVCALAVDLLEVGIGLWWNKRRKAVVGVQSLVGQMAIAVGELGPDGQVKVNGEFWTARCEQGCSSGSEVVVRRVDGLTLEVEPV